MLTIIRFDPYEGGKSFLGTFDVKIENWQLTIKNLSFFKSKHGHFYIKYPSKQKNTDGKWEHEFTYVKFEGIYHDKFRDACISDLKKMMI